MINKANVEGLNELELKLDQLKVEVQSSETKDRMSKLLREIIYKRVKSGLGVNDESSSKPSHVKLKALSLGYISMRQRLSGTHVTVRMKKDKRRRSRVAVSKDRQSWFRKGQYGEFFDPKRSNLTMTGQLLNSIADEATPDGIRVFIPNTKRNDSNFTNAQVFEFVRKERGFFALTEGEYRILSNEFENIVKEKIKVIFGQ